METQKKDSIYYNIKDIAYNREIGERVLFPFAQLNFKTGGMAMPGITIISSESDNGKSVMASQIIVNSIQQGYKILAAFGEHSIDQAVNMVYKQVTRYNESWETKTYIDRTGNTTNITQSFIGKKDEEKAKALFDDRLYLYNIQYSLNLKNMLDAFTKARNEDGCRLFLVDNIMQIDLETSDSNREVTDIVERLRLFAIRQNVHIIIVAHMKKKQNRDAVRYTLDDILGTSNLPNKAMTVFSLIRLDKIDRSTKEAKKLASILISQENIDMDACDSVLEILKCKWKGLGFVGLKYNSETNTFSQVSKLSDIQAKEMEKKQEKEKDMEQIAFDDEDILDIF